MTPSRSDAAVKADELFWQTFHNGEYEKIPNALEVLTAAYVQTPNDAVTAAHIAWLHNWRITERNRLGSVPATITDDMMLSRRYFQEAVKLDPSDARYLGFLAGNTLAEGNLHKDEKLTHEGYFMLLDSIKAWPEFNLFTGGYIMSRLPADSPRFREGLEWQWRTLDECIEGKIDRANPDYSKYMAKETREGKRRPCWNSWIAPHNFEGFFTQHGGHAGQIGRLANRAKDLCKRGALEGVGELEVPGCPRRSHQPGASERCVVQRRKRNTEGKNHDQLGVFLHRVSSELKSNGGWSRLSIEKQRAMSTSLSR